MSENKTQPANKEAMSRALGAAFLSHRVEELEKSVSSQPRSYQRGDRKLYDSHSNRTRGAGGGPRRGTSFRQHIPRDFTNDIVGSEDSLNDAAQSSGFEERGRTIPVKDADIVIVDASVLIHALGQLKIWCRNNREEVIIVPLEVLNTLDLLKKGTNVLAQRARAASRILEQQVGTNPRIRVQRDDAYVLWEQIPCNKVSEDATSEAKPSHPAPEWLRRVICCARWELDKAAPADSLEEDQPEVKETEETPSVVVAVCNSPLETLPLTENSQSTTSPVPLPAPQTARHEQRYAGTLITHWAKEAGLSILEVKPTPLNAAQGNQGAGGGAGGGRQQRSAAPNSGGRGHVRGSSDEEWRVSGGSPKAPVGKKQYNSLRARGNGPHSELSNDKGKVYGPGRSGSGVMVERPAATMAMNASMMQPSKVIRVLARGEKLDP